MAAAGAALAMAAPSPAIPTRDWAGASRVVVVCRAAAETPAASVRLEEQLCAAVTRAATDGAALPVISARFGDPAMFDGGSLVLLVNAAARPDAEQGRDRRLISFGIRPWRAIFGEENDLFGGAPQIARVPASGIGGELDSAIAAALDAVLPWRRKVHP